MNELRNDPLRYLTINATDKEWEIVITTVGYQFIPSDCTYPLSRHPEKYNFRPQTGHILNEYQSVYITKDSGYFSSQSCRSQKINAGTMILLFPGERRSYYPDRETGWDEHWVGFRDIHIDKRVERRFFTREESLHRIGSSTTIIGLYEDILKFASEEKPGYQQMISSIVLHILSSVYYKEKNNPFANTYVVDKVNKTRILMKGSIEDPLSPEEITARLDLGYSWFCRVFKEYTGVPPAQYRLQQKLLRTKELLTSTPLMISEIARSLHFENADQFSTFFKRKEGVIPSEFGDQTH